MGLHPERPVNGMCSCPCARSRGRHEGGGEQHGPPVQLAVVGPFPSRLPPPTLPSRISPSLGPPSGLLGSRVFPSFPLSGRSRPGLTGGRQREMISRAQALRALEALSSSAAQRLYAGDSGAVDLVMLDRSAHSEQLAPVLTTCTATRQTVRLAQLWVVIAALHAHLVAGKKLAQRELWYRLKPLRLFDSSAQVYERILEVCAVISAWCGMPCPRESLGVVAAPRGSMTGLVSLSNPDGTQPLDEAVYAIPGDPEACCSITFAESRARYIVVVEKDTVFTRLVQDGFIRHLPCVLITACGFPSLAVRALVQHVVKVRPPIPCRSHAGWAWMKRLQ